MNRMLAGLILLGGGTIAIATGTYAQDAPHAEAKAHATLNASIEANDGRYSLARYTRDRPREASARSSSFLSAS